MVIDINKDIHEEGNDMLVCPNCLKKWNVLSKQISSKIVISEDVNMPSYDAIEEELASNAVNELISTNLFCPACDSIELKLINSTDFQRLYGSDSIEGGRTSRYLKNNLVPVLPIGKIKIGGDD